MKFLQLLLFILALLVLSSCSVRQADLTAVTTRNVKLDGVNLNSLPGKRIEGKDSKFVFLFIPIGLPHLEDAVDDALSKGKGDLMLDAVIHTQGWWFLVGQSTIKVKGTVLNTTGANIH